DTKASAVTATLSATGATQYLITGDVVDDPRTFQWRPLVATVPLTLSPGDGPKDVHVNYRDAAGNISERVTASTRLDTQPPTLLSVKLVGSHVDGTPSAEATATLDVEVQLSGSGASQVAFSTGAAPDCQTATYD